MTNGILLMGHDTPTVPYGLLATYAAQAIKKHLGLPVCLITDMHTTYNAKYFDEVKFNEIGNDNQRFDESLNKKIIWRNTDRSNAFDLSPFDKTILMDVDYLVQTSTLLKLFEQDIDFLCHRQINDVTGGLFDNSETLGSVGIPFAWATVVYFTKGEYSANVFDTWNHVKKNWDYYTSLYNVQKGTFRNDFALSMALHMINGQVHHNKFIPWKLNTVPHRIHIRESKILYERMDPNHSDLKKYYVWAQGMDLHFLNKQAFLEYSEALANG